MMSRLETFGGDCSRVVPYRLGLQLWIVLVRRESFRIQSHIACSVIDAREPREIRT